MTLFIKKILSFFLLIAFTVLSVSFLFNSYINKKTQFSLSKNVTNIIFGHSHPEVAFNDSLISNFQNLAQSGESYFYTFLKTILKLKMSLLNFQISMLPEFVIKKYGVINILIGDILITLLG